ncbi:hypothetical protein Stm18_049 [Stenotrophomonas phage Stm18]
MNKLYDLAVTPSDLGMELIAAATPEAARAVIGAGTGVAVEVVQLTALTERLVLWSWPQVTLVLLVLALLV